MKKIISLILALTLVLSLATVVSAEDQTFNGAGEYTFTNKTTPTNVPPYEASGDVKVTVTGAINPVYYVKVEWKDLSFTYSNAGTQWDPESHTYSTVTGGWSAAIENAVRVTNHSNADLICTFALKNDVADDGINVTVSNLTPTTMKSAADVALGSENVNSAAFASTNVSVSGTPDRTWINDNQTHVVATVTATISLPNP